MQKYKLFRGLACISAFLMMAATGMTIGMFANAGHINNFLGIETDKLVPNEDAGEVELPTRYASKFADDVNNITAEDRAAKNAAADAFIEREAEEGAVLLKNEGNALPLTADEIKSVSLFGRATVDPMYKSQSGGGEGGEGTTVSYLKALEERGFKYNQTLVNAYNGDTSDKTSFDHIGESPASVYTSAVTNSFGGTDVAIVMLSRTAGESHDLVTNYKDSDGKTIGMLELTKNERDMMEIVKRYRDNNTFKKVIVLLNTSNAIEVDWLDDYSVDACMWIGGPGRNTGFRGVADLLTGASNPSGRLTDTYATSSFSAPAMMNFGDFTYSNGGGKYVIYNEGIYVGYRYYETRYEDAVLGQGNAASSAGVYASANDTWNYADEVVYPFGHGLSYTTFTQTLDKVVDNGRTLTATVTVTNTGDVEGKSVVELYAQTPYGDYEKKNNVEKSAVQLVAFDKTDSLKPNGGKQTLEITVDKYFLASYDYTKAKTYIMSEGDYYLSLGDDAHDALNNILAAKGASGMTDPEGNAAPGDTKKVFKWEEDFDDETYSVTAATGAEVTNRFDEADFNYWQPGTVTYLSRSDWKETYPETLYVSRTENMVEESYSKPEDAPGAYDIPTDRPSNLNFADMWDVDWNSEYWDELMDSMSMDDIISLTQDVRTISAVTSINFPEGTNADGPDGIMGGNAFVTFNLACSSWSTDMLAERGDMIAEDCIFNGVQFLWGPGFNVHRTPYAARNFEYVSEDGYLGYELGAATVAAMQAKGLNVGVKHFAGNDQDTNRSGVDTYFNEQEFREINLRMFEGSFVKGKTMATMLSTSKVGLTHSTRCPELLIDVLRGEWGFKGMVITDACGGSETNVKTIEAMAYGTNVFCFSDKAARSRVLKQWIVGQDDGYLFSQIKERAKETLYAYAHSNMMNGLSSNMHVETITPWWQPVMICVDVFFGVVMLGMIACFALWGYVFNKKKEERTDEVS